MKKITRLDELGIDWRSVTKKHAVQYITVHGWKVIPLHNPVFSLEGEVSCSCSRTSCDSIGKHPRIKDWVNNATRDIDQLNAWFDIWPDMNIGVVTGEDSGLIVLDADGVKGKRSLMSSQPVPYTATVKSGVGLHYYLKHPGRYVKTIAGVLPGVDSRGEGGYVCAPPSLHKRGYRYEWLLATELADAPQWWLDLVEKPVDLEPQEVKFDVKVSSAQLHAYARKALENELAILYSTPIGKSLRNKNLNKASFSLGQLISGGALDEELVRSCLWDAAIKGMKMDEDEARKTMESGLRGGKSKPRILTNSL